MSTKCPCGGTLEPEHNELRFFIWRCNKCGKRVRQNKRQSKRESS